jgi:hypothetical protein
LAWLLQLLLYVLADMRARVREEKDDASMDASVGWAEMAKRSSSQYKKNKE